MTVKSWEWWLSAILLIALLAVIFDDLFRKWRGTDMREAVAGMAQVMLNDRAYCLKRANDAIFRHNKLILQGDTLAEEADALSKAEKHIAIRSMAIQAAESGPVVETEYAPATPGPGPVLPVAPSYEPEDKTQVELTVDDGSNGNAEPSTSVETDAAGQVQYSTLVHGKKSYKVPTPIRLLVQAQLRKIENQRLKITQLEERLSTYEKD